MLTRVQGFLWIDGLFPRQRFGLFVFNYIKTFYMYLHVTILMSFQNNTLYALNINFLIIIISLHKFATSLF